MPPRWPTSSACGGDLSAHSRRLLGAGTGRQRLEARLRAHLPLAPDASGRSGRHAGGGLRWPLSAGSRDARSRRRARRAAAASSARSMRATSANPTSCGAGSDGASTRRRSPRIAETFHNRHLQTYGHNNRSEPVQIVSVRVAAIGAIAPLAIRDKPAPPATDALKGTRRALVSRDRSWSRQRYMIAHACPPES